MPWKSVQQARWGHSPAGKKALGTDTVKEFDEATPTGSLAGTKGSKKSVTGRHKLQRGEFRRGGYDWKDYE